LQLLLYESLKITNNLVSTDLESLYF
jgi:hypothetical protein